MFSKQNFVLKHSLDFFATKREDLSTPNKMTSLNASVPDEKRLQSLTVKDLKTKSRDENLSEGEIRWDLSASLNYTVLKTEYNYKAKQNSGKMVCALSWKAELCFSNSHQVLQIAQSNKFVLLSNWNKNLVQNLQIVGIFSSCINFKEGESMKGELPENITEVKECKRKKSETPLHNNPTAQKRPLIQSLDVDSTAAEVEQQKLQEQVIQQEQVLSMRNEQLDEKEKELDEKERFLKEKETLLNKQESATLVSISTLEKIDSLTLERVDLKKKIDLLTLERDDLKKKVDLLPLGGEDLKKKIDLLNSERKEMSKRIALLTLLNHM